MSMMVLQRFIPSLEYCREDGPLPSWRGLNALKSDAFRHLSILRLHLMSSESTTPMAVSPSGRWARTGRRARRPPSLPPVLRESHGLEVLSLNVCFALMNAWTDVSGLPRLHTFHWTMYGGVDARPSSVVDPERRTAPWSSLRELCMSNHGCVWSPHTRIPLPTALVEFRLRTRSARKKKSRGPDAAPRGERVADVCDHRDRGQRRNVGVFGVGLQRPDAISPDPRISHPLVRRSSRPAAPLVPPLHPPRIRIMHGSTRCA